MLRGALAAALTRCVAAARAGSIARHY